MHKFWHINNPQIINLVISYIKLHQSKIDNFASRYIKPRITFLIDRNPVAPLLFSAKNKVRVAWITQPNTSEFDYMVFPLFQRNIEMPAERYCRNLLHPRISLGILSANHDRGIDATARDFGCKQRDRTPSLRSELIHGRGSANQRHLAASAEQQNETESNNKPNSHREIMHRKTPVNDRFIALLGQMEGFVAPLRSLLTIAGGPRQSAVDATVSQRRWRMA